MGKRKSKSTKFENLIGPTDRKVDKTARDRLVTARVTMLMQNAFFGNLATRLTLINADEWCSTAATDGKNFYYNSRFITALQDGEVVFLFAHEILHLVYDHLTRRGDRDPLLWNIAGDYAINADLREHKVGKFITSVDCLYDRKYLGKSSEEIYDDLFKQAEKNDKLLDELIDSMIDEHLNGEGGDSSEVGPEQMSESEKAEVAREFKQAIISAAQSATASGHHVPTSARKLIEQITEPKMNWRQLLDTDLPSLVKSDYTYRRPSRRGWHQDSILPGHENDQEVDVSIAIDTSGSIDDKQVADFLGEVSGIMSQFSGWNLHVFCFDTSTHAPADFTTDSVDDITSYKPDGGGGTSFSCIFEYLKTREQQTKKLIVFTDGYNNSSYWGPENFCDVTWILHGKTKVEPPFGQWAYYEE